MVHGLLVSWVQVSIFRATSYGPFLFLLLLLPSSSSPSFPPFPFPVSKVVLLQWAINSQPQLGKLICLSNIVEKHLIKHIRELFLFFSMVVGEVLDF